MKKITGITRCFDCPYIDTELDLDLPSDIQTAICNHHDNHCPTIADVSIIDPNCPLQDDQPDPTEPAPAVSKTETPQRLSAKEWINKMTREMPFIIGHSVFPYITEAMTAFAQQEVSHALSEKDEEIKVAYGNGHMCGEMDQNEFWKEKIRKAIERRVMRNSGVFDYAVDELESLLKEE